MNPSKSKPLGIMGRAKAAIGVMSTGKLPNPLASEPKDRSRGALVKELNSWCLDTRKFWEPVFRRMRQEQQFAAGKQWPQMSLKDSTPDNEDYIGDTMQQMVNRKQAALYAKNPTPEAVLRDRMNFEVWDGRQDTIDNCKALVAKIAPQAMQAHEAELQGQPVPPPPSQMTADVQEAMAIMQDYTAGMQEKAMIEKVANTGEILIKQQWDEQSPSMLISGKQAVAQVVVSRASYVKVLYKRDLVKSPTETANEDGFSTKAESLQAQLGALQNDLTGDDDAAKYRAQLMAESLNQQLQELQSAQEEIGDEGIVLDWLGATSILVDRRCKCLKEFIGAHRIAHEIMMTVEECEAKFGVNLRDAGAKFYTETGNGWKTESTEESKADGRNGENDYGKSRVCVFEIQDKDDGLVYTVCDGVKDLLEEPHANEPEVNRFWSIVPLNFNAQVVEVNDPDNDCTIFSRSDVRLAMPMQINTNWAGQEKRKHRQANRPAWLTFASAWSGPTGEADLARLSAPRSAHDVFQLQSLTPDADLTKLLQPLPKQPFDEWLYNNAPDEQAMMLATGMQASDLGQQRPDEKATGQNIAAQSRATSEASYIADLDFFYSVITQMMWEMLISPKGMRQATVKKKIGRGAMWPDINREIIADSVYFKIEAGSMGRPNQQANLQKIEVVMPRLIEMFAAMGKSPEPLAKMLLKEMDANIDLDVLLKDAAVLPPPAPPQEQQKMPSVSISANLKDLAPTEHTQAVQKYYGIQPASPQETLINKAGIGKAIDAHTQNNQPQQEQA